MDKDDIPDIHEAINEANDATASGLCEIPEEVLKVVSPAFSQGTQSVQVLMTRLKALFDWRNEQGLERNPIIDMERLDMTQFVDCPDDIKDRLIDFDDRILLWQMSIGEIQGMTEFVADVILHVTMDGAGLKPVILSHSLNGHLYSPEDTEVCQTAFKQIEQLAQDAQKLWDDAFFSVFGLFNGVVLALEE